MEYLFVVRNPASIYVWLGVPLLIAMCYWFLKYVRSMPRADIGLKKILVFFLGWFFVGSAPFYNIVIPLHATLTEHWLYFPEIGLLVFMAILLFQFYEKIKRKLLRYIVILGLACLVCYYGASTVRRNHQWKDPMQLYQHDLSHEPNSFILHNNVLPVPQKTQ